MDPRAFKIKSDKLSYLDATKNYSRCTKHTQPINMSYEYFTNTDQTT